MRARAATLCAMTTIRAQRSTRIDAPAAIVYEILADYRERHPALLPPAFSNVIVESGGVGAGTVIRFDVKIGGITRAVRAKVTEPEPGRVLAETDFERGAVTSFTVEPRGERACEVTIATEWTASGLRALVERWMAPPKLEALYAEELANLRRAAESAVRAQRT
jgi:hypothetical protein